MKILLFAILSAWAGHSWEELPAPRLRQMVNQPCTFVHVWATWCAPCVQQLPRVMKTLATMKKVRPIVVDLSPPFVQESFSKKYLIKVATQFKTYLKPPGPDLDYMLAIDPKWNKGLPYSALFDHGQRKKMWPGNLNLKTLGSEVASLCK